MGSIAFFDFDGTITTKDSLGDFIQYAVGKRKYYAGLLFNIPLLASFKLKLTPNYIAKEKLFSFFFKGWEVADFQKLADRYSVEQIDKITRFEAVKKITWHKQQGHKIVVVSASLENWLKSWCLKNDLELIATQLEISDGEITGNFASKNCYSSEKAKRIIKEYNLKEYNCIYAYGDSKGDKEMLDLAHQKFYRCFN